jgi:hypothetical protein
MKEFIHIIWLIVIVTSINIPSSREVKGNINH